MGTPVAGTPHVLWMTPFCEDCFSGDEVDGNVTLSITVISGVEEGLTAAAFEPSGQLAVLVGEAPGVFFYTSGAGEVTHEPLAGSQGFVEATWSADGSVVYLVRSPERDDLHLGHP
ncbi:MAG: hypothetical protein ACI9WU_004216, partial [Myxococcota bacterium]